LGLVDDAVFALRRRCPVCGKGSLFKPWSAEVVKECGECHANLGLHDVGDGASVFLIFLLGFTVLPLAVVLSLVFALAAWLVVAVCGVLVLVLVMALLPPVKAYIILLEYRHIKRKPPAS
jgi:uncharacterized protein (DUF983 family)